MDAVPRGETADPTGPAAELAEARPRLELQELDHVGEVDQEPRGLVGRAPERLFAQPAAAFLADRVGVVDLGLLALVSRHGLGARSGARTGRARGRRAARRRARG